MTFNLNKQMKKLLWFISIILFVAGCNTRSQNLNYPETRKVDTVDVYFGTEVPDPYRWLEDDNSAETKEWVVKQNTVTFDYLENISFRDTIEKRLKEIWNYERMSTPQKIGGKYFFSKNDGLQNQSIYFMQKDLASEPEVVLDPNKLSEEGTVAVSIFSVSDDGKYLAYGLSKGGSDWVEIHVKNLQTGEYLQDHLKWVKFSGASWYKDGFYYSRYGQPLDGQELTNVNEHQMLYYHKLGATQEEDQLVYKNDEVASMMFNADVINERYLIIYVRDWNSLGNALYMQDLKEENTGIKKIANDFGNDFYAIAAIDGKLLVLTNKKAPNYQLLTYDLKSISPDNYKVLIPGKSSVLESVTLLNGKIYAQYMKDVHNVIELYGINGDAIDDIDLPGKGSIQGFTGEKDDTLAFYTYTSYTSPATIYLYNSNKNTSREFFTPKVSFDKEAYTSSLKFYQSKDGTKVPMYVVHKKGIKLDGSNPTLLYGYGGFNVTYMPRFRPSNIIWLENGGIYAIAHIRGGGEYGEEWHKAGMKLKKQNVFDDFIAAAEYLISENYTNPEKLAVYGGSNGGLLVGAVINQRPELFEVAFPAVGVMDMLRFHKFTIGGAWVSEYGSSEDSTDFVNLHAYSPIHNIKENIPYPAVMVTTADHDDRVVPAHSFKYIATLQEKYRGENPVLIRIETDAGHSAGKPVSKRIEEATDRWSFAFHNMGIQPYK